MRPAILSADFAALLLVVRLSSASTAPLFIYQQANMDAICQKKLDILKAFASLVDSGADVSPYISSTLHCDIASGKLVNWRRSLVVFTTVMLLQCR